MYYRISENRSYVITPDELINITITVPYQSKSGTSEKLTIGLELKYTIDNGTTSETNDEIKQNAPATYYTQKSMTFK